MKVTAKVEHIGLMDGKDKYDWKIIIDDKRTNGAAKCKARIDGMQLFDTPEAAVKDLNTYLNDLEKKTGVVVIEQDELVKV